VIAKKALALAALLSAALGSLDREPPGPNQGEPFIVAIVQANGSLIPFAVHDGQWRAPWPDPDTPPRAGILTMPDVPRDWTAGVLVPDEWRLWLTSGTAHTITVSRPAHVDSVCSRNWTLLTDVPPQTPTCRNCCPGPTLGVALSTTRRVTLPRPARGSELPMAALEAALNAGEDRAVADAVARGYAADGRLHRTAQPTDPAARRSEPILIEHAWTVATPSGPPLQYVEAVRRYGDPASCPAFSFFQAWIQSGPAPVVLHHTTSLNDCDMKGEHFDRPLAMITLPDGPYVIVERLGWESQEHAILHVGPAAVTPRLIVRLR
jgi:hypothetical protein